MLRPVAAIESAVLDGFREVRDGEISGAFKVGDGAGDLEDAVVSAGGKTLLLHGALEESLGVGRELAVGANLAGGHLRIGVDFFAVLAESGALALARGKDA